MRNLVPLFLAASPLLGMPCDPGKPAPCNPDGCTPTYCLGPSLNQGNAPVRPYTCDGDFEISASALYWKATQDGMEYAYKTNNAPDTTLQISTGSSQNVFDLVSSSYLSPKPQWNTGFRVGVAYNSSCDGWDVGIKWTRYKSRASSLDQANTMDQSGQQFPVDGETLAVLWTAFQGVTGLNNLSTATGFPPFASELRTNWETLFNIIDLELGREYYVSKYLKLHPFLGLRFGGFKQNFEMLIKGGYWSEYNLSFNNLFQPALNGEVTISNHYEGLGVVSGFNLNWSISCGWSVYSNLGGAILFGRFDVIHNENARKAESPFGKIKVLETKNAFRASRGIFDFGLGLQWSSLICDCKYGVTAQLGFEEHLYFHQNQMWRVNREVGIENGVGTGQSSFPNNSGENAHYQKRGTLSTGGLTFTFKFDF